MTMINLNSKELAALEQVIAKTEDVKSLKRAQALIWLADGDSVDEVANHLRVSRQTIYNWVARFESRNELPTELRVADAARQGRPRTAKEIIDPLIDEVADQDPRELGYGSTIWTAPLLCRYLADKHQIEVCSKSVSFALRRLRIAWKSPRHHLALRSETWRQAKGG